MIHRTAEARTWTATPYPGVQLSGLRRNDEGGGAALVKVAAGARVPTHEHPGGEDVYVLSGRCVVGALTLTAGDYLWTPPGPAHDLTALEDTLLFVNTPRGVKVVE